MSDGLERINEVLTLIRKREWAWMVRAADVEHVRFELTDRALKQPVMIGVPVDAGEHLIVATEHGPATGIWVDGQDAAALRGARMTAVLTALLDDNRDEPPRGLPHELSGLVPIRDRTFDVDGLTAVEGRRLLRSIGGTAIPSDDEKLSRWVRDHCVTITHTTSGASGCTARSTACSTRSRERAPTAPSPAEPGCCTTPGPQSPSRP